MKLLVNIQRGIRIYFIYRMKMWFRTIWIFLWFITYTVSFKFFFSSDQLQSLCTGQEKQRRVFLSAA